MCKKIFLIVVILAIALCLIHNYQAIKSRFGEDDLNFDTDGGK